jgi:hypothetical protein
LAGCKTTSKSVQVRERVIVDTFTLIKEAISIPYAVPGDTVVISIPAICDSFGKVKSFVVSNSSKRASIKASVVDGVITIQADCKAYQDSVYALNTYTSHLRQQLDSLSFVSQKTIEVIRIPSAYKWAMGFTVIFFLGLLIFIIYKILKPFLKWTII